MLGMYQNHDFGLPRSHRIRSGDRMRCNIPARLLNGSEEFEITILDSSPLGLLIWLLNDVPAGSHVEINMHEIGCHPARIAWCKDGFAGVEFIAGLRPSELLILRRQSTLAQHKPQRAAAVRSVNRRLSQFVPRCTFLR